MQVCKYSTPQQRSSSIQPVCTTSIHSVHHGMYSFRGICCQLRQRCRTTRKKYNQSCQREVMNRQQRKIDAAYTLNNRTQSKYDIHRTVYSGRFRLHGAKLVEQIRLAAGLCLSPVSGSFPLKRQCYRAQVPRAIDTSAIFSEDRVGRLLEVPIDSR